VETGVNSGPQVVSGVPTNDDYGNVHERLS
jgi:hypothetical protein